METHVLSKAGSAVVDITSAEKAEEVEVEKGDRWRG